MRTNSRAFWLLLAPLMVVLSFPAWATLGEISASTGNDRASMKASARTAPAANYTVHEIQAPSGTVVREYVSDDGMVFAVGWQGPLMPDLRHTLGSYFDRYTAAASANRTGHRQVVVRDTDFVVQSSGHMRAFSGRAYLPQLLPQGFTLDQLR